MPIHKISVERSAVRTFRAAWVHPILADPIRNGRVLVREGRVAGWDAVSGPVDEDLGDVALIPGLVNAHTHLEFSSLQEPLGAPGEPFPRWIGRVIAWRRERDADPEQGRSRRYAAIRCGLDESSARGVAAVGEIATPGWEHKAFDSTACFGRIFLELLGLSLQRVEALTQAAADHLKTTSAWPVGLSPHAPYTVHPRLLETVCALSREHRIPLAMHLAETMGELELLRSASGPLVTFLRDLGAWDASAIPRGVRPLEYLSMLSTAHRVLVIHGNYLVSDELDFLAQHRERMTVVYCPRTHAYFGHRDYPVIQLLERGVPVALGTDSRASNPDLNLWQEMRFVATAFPTLSAETILKMGTWNGAAALELNDFGHLMPGARAEFLAIPINPGDGIDGSLRG